MEEEAKIEFPPVKLLRKKDTSTLKGPLRLARLCILSIILPGILIAGPLYLRYRVYSGQIYPVGMSDMRLVDNRISTTWCQRQLVKSNATFNAYLLPSEPQMKPNPVPVSMVRRLTLRNDMKEYWGFYLIKGSSFTVSTCTRWEGAILTVIRGHKELRECAYFGDNSSEETDELDEIDGGKKSKEENEDEGESNEPWRMKKARPGVIFYGPEQQMTMTNHRLSKEIAGDTANEIWNDWLTLRNYKSELDKKFRYQEKNDAEKNNSTAKNIKVNSSNATAQSRNEKVNETKKNDPLEDVYQEFLSKLRKLGYHDKNVLLNLNERLEKEEKENKNKTKTENVKRPQNKREITWQTLEEELNEDDEGTNAAVEEIDKEANDMYKDIRGTFNKTTSNDTSNSEFWSSFSSSEERLINCDGLIVNLPLATSLTCWFNETEEDQAKASLANKFTYTVPTNGYYFFVFSSENEIQLNYIRVEFQFEKIQYNVSNPVAACTNTTESCSLPLNFFSWEKTVLEMPLSYNESMWNEEFVVVSVCEPRTMIYAACMIAVPVLILLFAF